MSDDHQAALEALAAEVGQLLVRNGEKLATAESCTGGIRIGDEAALEPA